jgi:catechol 2,3-dioxygenase-like lactoylglutathione lyase family enzyme
MTENRGFKPRALGEIAIRCADLSRMSGFYGDVLGLDRLSGNASDGIIFFRIAEGFGGHTAVLALFRNDIGTRPGLRPTSDKAPATGAHSLLHHIALSLPFAEQDAAIAWYEKIGQPYSVEEFHWIGWRGVFTEDPEGNTVELLAYDASMQDA